MKVESKNTWLSMIEEKRKNHDLNQFYIFSIDAQMHAILNRCGKNIEIIFYFL